jgi:hypothetical protein
MSTPIRIMAVSLVSARKFKATAIWSGDQLVIADVAQLPTSAFSSWRKTLTDDVLRAKEKGFIVLIEERTDLIARHGTQYLLEEMGDEGRSNYYDAFDWYFALAEMGNVLYDASCRQYSISVGGEGGKVDKGQDDKGRPIYKVNWGAFHGGFRAVLLCVVAAMQEPLSDRFLVDYHAALESFTVEQERSPAERFAFAVESKRREEAEALDKERIRINEITASITLPD